MPLTFNTNQYMANLRQRGQRTLAALEQHVAKTAVDLDQRTVERTPVDTGAARAGWSAPQQIGPLRWEFTNNTAYILILEFGGYANVGPKTVATGEGIFSQQAPGGMLRISIEELRPAYHAGIRVILRAA